MYLRLAFAQRAALRLSYTPPAYRARYAWSDFSPFLRSSEQIIKELDTLLNKARIEPLYILVRDYLRSFNVR